MDYYEELGISPDATDEEIRRAHRRMTKLFHPDQHTDEGLKQLGEVQMRRLNSIVGVLLNPESRREYDLHLRNEAAHSPVLRPAAAAQYQRRRTSWSWWVASTAAAIILTIIVVLFWASNLGSSFGNHSPTYIPPDSGEAPASAAEVSRPSPARPGVSTVQIPEKPITAAVPASENPAPIKLPPMIDTPTVVQAAAPSRTVAKVPAPRNETAAQKQTDIRQNAPARKSLVLPNTAVVAQARPEPANVDLPPPPGVSIANSPHLEAAALPAALPPAAKPPAEPPEPAKTVSYSVPIKPSPADPLEGEWVYAPSGPEKKKVGFYPPEFIDLKLFRDAGRLYGQYHARYHVTDKPISPDVEFALKPDSENNRFTWAAPNGTRGTFKISSVDPKVIRIEWRTTVFGRQPALTAGTATLVKRTQ